MSSLLPINATEQEQAIAEAIARIGDVPVPLRDLWNPDTCPADLLPWLAWALSIDTWSDAWPESVRRQRIKSAIKIQRRKGTVRSVRDVVTAFGGNLSVIEWFQMSPVGTPHTFGVLLTVGGGVPATTEYQDAIIDEISRTKPVRSHFTLTAGVTAEGAVGIQGAARPAVYARVSTVEQV